ncbi:hypothetical protein ECG_01169 [Echinococcus granulosus]|nr:hypothetical protein ECG_01169 [Echinococcus granulosus]
MISRFLVRSPVAQRLLRSKVNHLDANHDERVCRKLWTCQRPQICGDLTRFSTELLNVGCTTAVVRKISTTGFVVNENDCKMNNDKRNVTVAA